jgi:hypothetical protein
MKKLLFSLIIVFTAALLLGQNKSANYSQNAYEDGKPMPVQNLKFGNMLFETYPGAVTVSSNFWDYQTNGNSLHQLFVKGDTVVIAFPAVDSTDPTGTSTRLAYYIVSYDGGVTWETPLALSILPVRSGYPEIYYYNSGGNANVVLSGRKYNGSNSRGGAWSEAFFGVGSFLSANVPEPGRDYFGAFIGGSTYAGLYSSQQSSDPSIDSLFFVKYDVVTNSMSGKTLIAAPPNEISGNVRYSFAASGNNLLAVWYDYLNTNEKLRYKTSTDGGTTWSSTGIMQERLGPTSVILGDTCHPYYVMAVTFKPGTSTWAAAWSTYKFVDSTQYAPYDNTGYKILFKSPGINGGNPVAVAGRHNMTNLSDTSKFYNHQNIQYGVTPISNPSIAYSDDGSRICMAFSSYQPDDTLDTYNFNDIWVTYSDNGGANWVTPVKLTNTPTWDELYPVLSLSGNTPTSFKIKFQATRGPGCQSFRDLTPTYRVYHEYKTFNPANVGVQNIGTNVPEKFSLKQNFPNPFNPVTKIRFDVSKTSMVTLKVYNILGQLVETLIDNETLSVGTKEIAFDGTNMNSGIYFYTLTSANGFKETKKMVLIK